MCEFCDKVVITKYGLKIDLYVAKGIYDNHGIGRYVVCRRDDVIYGVYFTFKEAMETVLLNKPELSLKIIDLKTMKEVHWND